MGAEMSQGKSRKRHIGSKSIELNDFSSKRPRMEQSELPNGSTQFLENESNESIERRSKADNNHSKSARGSSQDKSDGNTSPLCNSYIERHISPICHSGRGRHSTDCFFRGRSFTYHNDRGYNNYGNRNQASNRRFHSRRKGCRGGTYTHHNDWDYSNYGNRNQSSNRRFQSRGRCHRGRSSRGSRGLHGYRKQSHTTLDNNIKRFLQKVDSSTGVDKVEVLSMLASESDLLKTIIQRDEHREHLLKSIKFALSLQITPMLTSSLVKTLIQIDFIKTLCIGLENDLFTFVPDCWFGILSDLIDILKRLFEFKICKEKFLSDSTSCITNLIILASCSEIFPEFGDETNFLNEKADVLDICMKRKTGKTSAMVSGDIEGESEDRSEYVKTESIFPHIADLQCLPKLLPINKTGGYKSFKEYMYIQFSLLREDFVGPLREGIRQFQSKCTKYRGQRWEHEPINTFSNIRVYDDVKIVSMVCDQGLNYVVTFDVSKLRQVRWESTGRLKYGSLVCLSHDNFSSMLVGVVVKADRRQRGEVHVEFNDAVDDHTIKGCMCNLFTMVESTAYFEAYRYILLKCKNMHQYDMSMSRYVVHCQKEILPPKYLLENSEPLFDLRTLCEKDTIVIRSNALAPFMKPEEIPITEVKTKIKNQGSSDGRKKPLERRRVMSDVIAIEHKTTIEHKTILTEDRQTDWAISDQSSTCKGMSIINNIDVLLEENDTISSFCSEDNKFSSDAVNVKHDMSCFEKLNILEDDDWPHYVTDRFDPSQKNAIKNALTKELSIIQGPPGCGKTYIGLEIVKVLLKNTSLWKTSKDDGPILVLCYTNHALDQFMEGISKSFTGGIVRVGGRSSSDILQSCNLRNIRSNMRAAKVIPDYIYKGRNAARANVQFLKGERIVNTKKITILKENIIHENALYSEMGTEIANQFKWRSHRVKGKHSIANSIIPSMIYDWLGIDDLSREVECMIATKGLDHVIQNDTETQQHEARDVLLETNTGKQYSLPDDRFNVKDTHIEKKLAEFMKETVALNISSLSERPTNADVAKWRIMRWHRLELIKKLHAKLRQLEHKIVVIHPGSDIYEFTMDERWCLYAQWVDKKCHSLNVKIENGVAEYKSTYKKYKEVLMLENRYIMKMADVIGMTTTCAAKHNLELQDINAKILIIEEAAEILESHIVSNIGKGCDQLILIGDHQQLRPKHSYYKLAKQFNIDISMFERLISSDLEYTTLEQQHRMAPAIANNIRLIYPNLVDHIVVTEYGDVLGMKNNMVFLNHRHIEECQDGTMSKKNYFEASFSIALATYFIQQGYSSSQVTILTTYRGQMFEIMTLKTKEPSLRGVKVTVVDNFQGEECDIIILSLVRSNLEGKIGFLKHDNRVCVALSRAKYGLYVLGNIEMYNTPLWKNILTSQSTKDLVRHELQLKCQNHPSAEPNLVSKVKDFAKVPEGGCLLPCTFVLPCGHVCPKRCHIVDKEHNDVVCQMPCERECKHGHDCNLICGKICRCEVEIEVKQPCEHAVVLKCYQEIVCPNMCEKELVCGHVCIRKCVEQCEPCEALVERKLQCGHLVELRCHSDISKYVCKEPCVFLMECGHNCPATCGASKDEYTMLHDEGSRQFSCEKEHVSFCNIRCDATLACRHKCTGTCSQCFYGRQHIPCIQKCKHSLICDHACPGTCNSCKPCQEPCKRWCRHQRCLEKCSDICSKCTEPCVWECSHFVCTKQCSEPCNRPRCDRRCRERLRCGHKCIGLCGEPCPIYCQHCKKDNFYKNCFGSQSCPYGSFVQLEDCGHAVEYKLLDSYFDNDQSDELVLKQCPICYIPIYNCRRYGGILNKLRDQIDRMKVKIFGKNYHYLPILLGYADSFDEILKGINVRNANILNEFIEDFRERYIGKYGFYGKVCNTSGTPTKQWIQDCTNEMYRVCDRMTILSIDQEKLEVAREYEQFVLLEEDVHENVWSKSPYTAEKRKKTIEFIRSIHGTTKYLANFDIELKWEGADEMTHSNIFCSGVQRCKLDTIDNNDRDDVKQHNEWLCIDSYSKTEAELREHEDNNTRSESNDEVVRDIGSNTESKMDPISVLDLPKTLTLYTLSCPEYFQCRKAPFPEEFRRVTKSLSDDTRHNKRTRHDRREDSIANNRQRDQNRKRHNKCTRHGRNDESCPNKRQRVQSEHSTSKREANIETVCERKHQHGTGRHSSRGGVDKTKEAHIRHTGSVQGPSKYKTNSEALYELNKQHGSRPYDSRGRVNKQKEAHDCPTRNKLVRKEDSFSTLTQYARNDNCRTMSTFDEAGKSIKKHRFCFTSTKIEMDDLSKYNQGLKGIDRKQRHTVPRRVHNFNQDVKVIDRNKKSDTKEIHRKTKQDVKGIRRKTKHETKRMHRKTKQDVKAIGRKKKKDKKSMIHKTKQGIKRTACIKDQDIKTTNDLHSLTKSVRNINSNICQNDTSKLNDDYAVMGETNVGNRFKVTLLDTSKVARTERNTEIETKLGPSISVKPDEPLSLQTNAINAHKDISIDLLSTQTQDAEGDNCRANFDRGDKVIKKSGSGFTYTKIEMDDISKISKDRKGIDRYPKLAITERSRKPKQCIQGIDRKTNTEIQFIDRKEKTYFKRTDRITNQKVQMIDLRRKLMKNDDP